MSQTSNHGDDHRKVKYPGILDRKTRPNEEPTNREKLTEFLQERLFLLMDHYRHLAEQVLRELTWRKYLDGTYSLIQTNSPIGSRRPISYLGFQ